MLSRYATIPLLVVLIAAGGCGGDPASSDAGSAPAPAEHDFGTIPHGHSREHVFELDIPGGGAGWVPTVFQTQCSCGRDKLMIRRASGTVEEVDSLAYELRTLQKNDVLLLSLTIDTTVKEPIDQPSVTKHGNVVLRDAEDTKAQMMLPVVFRYAIDAAIQVLPVAHVDFGALPYSRTYEQTLELVPDRVDPPVIFGPVEVTDPRLTAKLRDEDGLTVLDIGFDPSKQQLRGSVRLAVIVHTDLDDYAVEIPVSGQVIADIVVEPFARISFGRFDLATELERYVNVTDHNLERDPGFVVASVLDSRGQSLAEHFEVRLEPIQGDERATRVFMRYLGKLQSKSFRGVLRLKKPQGDGPDTDIEFVGFQQKT